MEVTNPFLVAADIFDPQPHPYAQDPVGYARDILGFHAWSKQREILQSVRDNPRTAVRACHGVGKTAGAAQVALWFLETHRNSRVITTAPTWAQVEQLLWREIRASVGRAHRDGKGEVFPKPAVTKLELGDEWFAIGLSTNEPERFQGHHALHLLLIVDEASGVDERIYEAAEGFQTAEGAKMLLIGNPTRTGGQFHRAFSQERALWNRIHISAFDSPNVTGEKVPPHVARALVTREWIENAKSKWGAGAVYQVRALGEFAEQGPDTVIPLGEIDKAQLRELEADSRYDRVVIACDVARFGEDETVITERVGQRVRILESYVGRRPPESTATGAQANDLVETAGRVAHFAEQHPVAHVRIVIDDTGVGGGVTDILRRKQWPVTAFNGGEKAFREDQFPNRRSELWFEGRAQMEDLDLDQDAQLAADLTAPKYTYDLKLRRVVERKEETKKRLGRSPDRGDAVLLTLVPEQSGGVIVPPPVGTISEHRSDDEILNDPM
jgi:phage terminase large subunit